MDRKKTWVDVHEGEILSDNSQNEDCKQCKNCAYRSDGTVWSNDYRKCSCMAYPYPSRKPLNIMENKEECYFYEKDDE